MSAPAGAPARAAYRQLLRAVSRHVTSVSGNGLFRDALRAEFRAAAAQRDPAAVAAAVRRAEDAAYYVTAVNEHKARAPVRLHARVCAARDQGLRPLCSRLRRRRTCCCRTASALTRRRRRRSA